jgi:stage II sporulation protein M
MLRRVPETTGQELRQYLSDYMRLEGGGPWSAQAVWSALVLYLRYPLLAFFLGFASVGVVLLPCAALAMGFFLSFSICCFTATFGSDGVLLALAALGVRCLVTLPCFFLLAAPSLETAASLADASFGRGRRLAGVSYGRRCWLRLGGVLLALLAGMGVDRVLSPRLLALILERIY